MAVVSKMKFFTSLTFSTFSIHPSKPTTFLVFSSPSKSTLFEFNPFLSLRFLSPQKPKFSLLKTSIGSIHNQTLQMGACRPPLSGEIHVIVGPMFAGKTTTLIRRIQSESGSGRSVAIIKSNKDTRYGLDSIVTHDGLKLPCYALSNLSSFKQNLGPHAYDQLEVIGIDEAQFFEDLYDFCCEAADIDGKTVIVAGLDGDYLRRRFGYVLDIIPLADSVTKLSAKCEICGGEARFTLRKTHETETEVIGGANVYMPVCRQHYVGGQAVIEAARNVVESKEAESGIHA